MHRTTNRCRAFAALCTLALAATACGGDDDGGGAASDGADTPIGQALTAEIMDDADGDDSVAQTEEEARCWSGKIVDDIGEDRLNELGVTADNVGDIEDIDFSEGEIDTIVDGMFDCVDVRASFATQFEGDFGAEGAQCVADELDEDLVKDVMKSAVSGDDAEPSDEFFQAFLDIAAKCDLPLN